MSDDWGAYQNIAQLNGRVYLPDVVVHQYNCVDPIDPALADSIPRSLRQS